MFSAAQLNVERHGERHSHGCDRPGKAVGQVDTAANLSAAADPGSNGVVSGNWRSAIRAWLIHVAAAHSCLFGRSGICVGAACCACGRISIDEESNSTVEAQRSHGNRWCDLRDWGVGLRSRDVPSSRLSGRGLIVTFNPTLDPIRSGTPARPGQLRR